MEKMDLSRHDCYAGKMRVEVMDASPELQESPHPQAYLYLQFVEGCGYSPYELTPQEADHLAHMLQAGAARARKNFCQPHDDPGPGTLIS